MQSDKILAVLMAIMDMINDDGQYQAMIQGDTITGQYLRVFDTEDDEMFIIEVSQPA